MIKTFCVSTTNVLSKYITILYVLRMKKKYDVIHIKYGVQAIISVNRNTPTERGSERESERTGRTTHWRIQQLVGSCVTSHVFVM